MQNESPKIPQDQNPLVGIVGVCASGKSSLIARLKDHGIKAKHIAQEHSFVKDMWLRITNPDILIFLDASYQTTLSRRRTNWNETDWVEQQRRLFHARQHAHLYVQTDDLSIDGVFEIVFSFLQNSCQNLKK